MSTTYFSFSVTLSHDRDAYLNYNQEQFFQEMAVYGVYYFINDKYALSDFTKYSDLYGNYICIGYLYVSSPSYGYDMDFEISPIKKENSNYFGKVVIDPEKFYNFVGSNDEEAFYLLNYYADKLSAFMTKNLYKVEMTKNEYINGQITAIYDIEGKYALLPYEATRYLSELKEKYNDFKLEVIKK